MIIVIIGLYLGGVLHLKGSADCSWWCLLWPMYALARVLDGVEKELKENEAESGRKKIQ